MKILIPHPPGPLLLQEKGAERNLGDTPRPPPERPSLSGLSTFYRGIPKGLNPLGGGMGVSPISIPIPPKIGG